MTRLASTCLLALGSAAAATAADDTIIGAHIQPIFEDYCVSCHGADKTKGKLRSNDLDRRGFSRQDKTLVYADTSATPAETRISSAW